MAKIYVSPETLKNLSKKGGYSEILNHFDINRPEPKQRNKTNKKENDLNKKQTKNKKTKMSKPTEQIRRVTLNVLKQQPKKSKTSPQQKHLMSDVTERRCSKNTKQSVSFFYSPTHKNHNSTAAFYNGQSLKNTHIHTKYLKEHHLLANESTSRFDNPKRQHAIIKAKNATLLNNSRKTKRNKL